MQPDMAPPSFQLVTPTDVDVRRTVRKSLDPDVFEPNPWMIWSCVPIFLLIAGIVALLLRYHPPWYLALPLALVCGAAYGSLMFFGHELAHGAMVRSRAMQDILLYPCFAIFCLPPRLWRIWHHAAHHAHTNMPGKDPDNFGTLEQFHAAGFLAQQVVRVAPGCRRLSGILYLCAFFALQGQSVLWRKSRSLKSLGRLKRRLAALESIALAGFWIGVCWMTGFYGTIFIVVVPMAVANAVVLSYVVTNHLLCRLSDQRYILATTMSVKTARLLDGIHFWFSHHVEHHLFPSMSSVRYGQVRSVLQEKYPAFYQCPSHFSALRVLFVTPRIYDAELHLVDPFSDRRVSVDEIKRMLDALNQRTVAS